MDKLKHLFIFFILLFCTYALLANKTKADEIDKKKSFTAAHKMRNGELVRNSLIYQQASNESPIVSSLLAEQRIFVYQRKRAWYFITTDEKLTGWLSMLNVRFNGRAKRTAQLGVASAFNSATKNTKPTQSTGIRGFDEADLNKAKADFVQLAVVNSYVIPPKSLQEFAKQGQLSLNKNIKVTP